MKSILASLVLLLVFSVNAYSELLKTKYVSFSDYIMIDIGFKKYMDTMDKIAVKYNLRICVQDSFRRKNTIVEKAIVIPFDRSNHFVGHAIDINIMLNDVLYNSTKLKQYKILPIEIKKFIEECKLAGLKWGGDIVVKDVVHFDDGLNYIDEKRYDELLIKYQN
jgi:hypothetical protein